MKNNFSALVIGASVILGILLFILTFNAVRSQPVASTVAVDPARAKPAAAPVAETPRPQQAAPDRVTTLPAASAPKGSVADEDASDDDTADEDATDDVAAEEPDDKPVRRGFTTPLPRSGGSAQRGITTVGDRSSSTKGALNPPRRGFTTAAGEAREIAPQNPFKRHGARGHWTSFEDATDYVAGQIFEAIEDRPTLVVWLFDRSFSAASMRDRVVRRFESVYQTFDGLKSAGHPSFADSKSPRLLSVVGSVGQDVEFLTPEPTDSSTQLVQAVNSIRDDGSGEEHTFAAIDLAVKQLDKHRAGGRLMMLVVVSDEAGDDDNMVDGLIPRLTKAAIPVYVIGVPAALGSKAPLGGGPLLEGGKPLRQGPESLEAEAIDMGGWTGPELPSDSGFGPFALSRLALETGGQYMAVRLITAYDQQQMARHAPDYVSRAAYDQLLSSNQARRALVEAARLPHVDLVARFDLLFPKPKDEAAMKRALDKAQQNAARLEPKVAPFYKALAAGESDRNKLTGARWQAGYDLAMGRAAAMRSRIEGYNAALAQLKAGKQFPDPNHTTWMLRPTNDVKGDSALEKLAGQARKYLTRVSTEHPGTPWATIANRELSSPLGWEWISR